MSPALIYVWRDNDVILSAVAADVILWSKCVAAAQHRKVNYAGLLCAWNWPSRATRSAKSRRRMSLTLSRFLFISLHSLPSSFK